MKKKYQDEHTRETFSKNEVEANRQMCFICAAAAGALTLGFIFYAFRLFPLRSYLPVYIALPILIVSLLAPLILLKLKLHERIWFKYFVLALILTVVGVMNTLLPKHTLLGYALLILLSNHYYNPKTGRLIFGCTLLTMLLCLYGSMFFGEYDDNLLTAGRALINEQGEPYIEQPDGTIERYKFLHELLLEGENRYLKVFIYYFFSRGLILTLIFVASNALSIRTHRLLENEAVSQSEKARITTELSVAEEIQRTVLPSATFQNKNVEIYAQLRPARAVGGDFYDYWFPDENHVAILIGDVSGKGVPAAMFMMKTITSFRASFQLGLKPSQVLYKVNDLIFAGNDASMFVTCFFGVLNIETGVFDYCNAGHNRPIYFNSGKADYLSCRPGMILGGVETVFLQDETLKLERDDCLLLYTDGVTEALSASGELYGEKRLLDFVHGSKHITLTEFGHDLEDDISEFAAGAEQSDDITYLCMTYQGDMTYFREKSFPTTNEATQEVRSFVEENAKKANLSPDILSNFLIATDEIFSNIVKYGQVAPDSEVHVRCIFKPDKKTASLTFIDRGIPFDPMSYQAKLMDERGESAEPGGLGWFMVRKMMDEVVYHRTNGKNVVSITKRL